MLFTFGYLLAKKRKKKYRLVHVLTCVFIFFRRYNLKGASKNSIDINKNGILWVSIDAVDQILT